MAKTLGRGERARRARNGCSSLERQGIDTAVAVSRNKARQILSILTTPSTSENGPVRRVESEVGKVVNLPDPWQNQRSKAAILAKKYQEENQKLRNIYNASQKRELTEPEVASVFAFMGWEYENHEGSGNPYESPFSADDLAGDGSGDGGSVEEPGGCPAPEYDDQGLHDDGSGEDMARCVAGPEEDQGDSCL